MSRKTLLDHFRKIDLPDPVDLVIQQIRDLIHSGLLKPGDRLPSEKSIEEKMGVARGAISKALRRLETYGILKTVPQSGTYVASIGVDALEGLLTNVLKLEDRDLEALDDTRYVLEIHAAELMAQDATDAQIEELGRIQLDIAAKIRGGLHSFDEDMVFHLKIAELCGNPILKSIVTLLVSDVLQLFRELEKHIGAQAVHRRLVDAIEEHERIVAAIRSRSPQEAAGAMKRHFELSREFRRRLLRQAHSR